MVEPPRTDAEVAAFAQALGLPGLVDAHVHFMPERVLAKVWAYFERLGGDGRAPAWPIHYRLDEAGRLARLRALGVRAFPSLLYAHRPGMAEWLNGWAAAFAARVPECVPTATFYPEPGADRYVAEALEAGARVLKLHLQVADCDPRDPLLAPVWRRLERARLPVVVHAGSGPHGGAHTGPGPLGEVLDAHPELVVVVAHMGAPEYAQFLAFCERYPDVHLDTTMVFTGYPALPPYPEELLPGLAAHADRVVLGSDYPNIPHPYARQIAGLVRLGLGDDWLRGVCWHNPARLLGLGDAVSGRPAAPPAPPAGRSRG